MSKFKSEELRHEYNLQDLGEGIRGKYFDNFKLGTNLVLLDPDVASNFDSEKAVNDTLRSLIKLSQKSLKKNKPTLSQ